MKLNRLLEITHILMTRRMVTAGELARAFGVSTRTIYRDVDALSTSGVPVCTTQGAGGGISLMDGYTISRAMLTESERHDILYAVQALAQARYPDADKVLFKLRALFKSPPYEWIAVDQTPWGGADNRRAHFSAIEDALARCRVLRIEYIDGDNCRSARLIRPIQLIYKGNAWYLNAYCALRGAGRTFRLSRIRQIEVTDEPFDRADTLIKMAARRPDDAPPALMHLVLAFSEAARSRLHDDFDDDRLRINEHGAYVIECDFPEGEWVYGYLLSFGPHVEVIEPVRVRQALRDRLAQALRIYQ